MDRGRGYPTTYPQETKTPILVESVKKFQKIKKEGSNTAYSVLYAVQTVVAQWFADFAYGAYPNFLNLFYETYFLWKYIGFTVGTVGVV